MNPHSIAPNRLAQEYAAVRRALDRNDGGLAERLTVGLIDEADVFHWAVTLKGPTGLLAGPWPGAIAHMHFIFKSTYPDEAPEVKLMTELPGYHPNVFRGGYFGGNDGMPYICLDMLKPESMGGNWSVAYTAESVIMQLAGFLVEDANIEQMGGGGYVATRMSVGVDAIQASNERAIGVIGKCPCGMHDLPKEVEVAPTAVAAAVANLAIRYDAPAPLLEDLPPDMVAAVLDQIEAPEDIYRFMRAMCPPGQPAPTRDDANPCRSMNWRAARRALQRLQQRCYYHGPLERRKGTVLGLGIRTVEHSGNGGGNRGRPSAATTVVPKDLTCVGTGLISEDAFDVHGLRRSVDNRRFDGFLPLAIDGTMERIALAQLPKRLAHILGLPPGQKPGADGLLVAMSMLIKSVSVEMVGGVIGAAAPPRRHPHGGYDSDDDYYRSPSESIVPLAMSDAALQIFCYLHQLLLAAVLDLPNGGRDILAAAKRHVVDFVDGPPEARRKARCPDLGVLLVELLLVPKDEMPWERFAPVFLREFLSRQVMWAIRGSGGDARNSGNSWIANVDFESADDLAVAKRRTDEMLKHGKVGLRLVCMQAIFGTRAARPATSAEMLPQLRAIKDAYAAGNGLPPEGLAVSFNATVKRIMAIDGWTKALTLLGVGMSPEKAPRALLVFASMLRQAVADSKTSGYHSGGKAAKKHCDWAADPPVVV